MRRFDSDCLDIAAADSRSSISAWMVLTAVLVNPGRKCTIVNQRRGIACIIFVVLLV